MQFSIAEILNNVQQQPTTEQKVAALRQSDSPTLRSILGHAFDPRIKFILPPGTPPYTPCPYLDQQAMLFREVRKLYLFVEAGGVVQAPNLTRLKRETMFIQMLESLDPKDAELVVAIKDRKVTQVTAAIVREAFPGLLPDEELPAPEKPKMKSGFAVMSPEAQAEARAKSLATRLRNRMVAQSAGQPAPAEEDEEETDGTAE